MKNYIFIFIILTLLGCNKKKSDIVSKNNTLIKPYIISYEDRKIKENTDSLKKSGSALIYLPRKGYYGESILIFDRNNDVFFYQNRYQPIFCSYGMENDTLPEFLNLQPKDLIKIPKKSIELFIEENIMKKEKKRQILIIASQKDTIKDEIILNFLHHFKVPTYIIRTTTLEEDIVLHYKKTNQYYYSKEINWDTTKIKLNKAKFIKP